jgi:hypothetical protein
MRQAKLAAIAMFILLAGCVAIPEDATPEEAARQREAAAIRAAYDAFTVTVRAVVRAHEHGYLSDAELRELHQYVKVARKALDTWYGAWKKGEPAVKAKEIFWRALSVVQAALSEAKEGSGA